MKRILAAAFAVALLTGCGSDTPDTPDIPDSPTSPTTQTAERDQPTIAGVIADNLDAPWSMVPLGADRALISERNSGNILLLAGGQTTVAGTLSAVMAQGEGGLLGLAMKSPDDDRLFAYYTAARDNRVVVLDFDGTTVSNERTVLDGIPKGTIHNGGRIAFGPDGFLYVATGEIGQPDLAQDPTSLAGKILRVKADGTPAPGNPEPQSPIWSLGHRNVQGLAWDSEDRLWATEFGAQDVDELNLIEAGKNYGWPQCEGPCDLPGTTNPKATWSPTSVASPSGLAIVDDSAWVAALAGQALYEIPLDATQAGQPQAWFDDELGRLRDVTASPDQGLWVLTNNTDGRGEPKTGDDQILAVAIGSQP